MKVFSALLCVSLIMVSASSFGSSKKVKAAKLIKNANTVEDAFTSRGGMEGWTRVSFIIDTDGTTKDIVVFDYSGKDRYVKKSTKLVQNLQYSPASINEKPVTSAQILFVKHTYSEAGHSEGSVTPAFAKEYQAIIDALTSPSANMSSIKVSIDELVEDHTKNLNEHALAAWLKSIYYYKNEDFLEYMRQSQITVDLYEYLPVAILAKSTVNLFQSQLYYGNFNGASETLARMGSVDGLNLSQQTHQQFADALKASKATESSNVTKGQLSSLGAWSQAYEFSTFKVDVSQGSVDSVELRCNDYQQKYVEGWENQIDFPAQASNCILLIRGDAGATFDILEITS
ncbi:energy transducer TonB [Alteromonas sp. CI.11.F.A3]|uniref:energy transducer TonB n=1 Tax=Alteromonas sp. CI.11.F.A3 TaxID=3079555 RepID=UPI002943C98B|nr:energy transducer TonB [Alteromonas sp. CI.11.F.A3]WOI38035.1 energy transducer TonB [Alteromonas sp. CI.11.F.A3]